MRLDDREVVLSLTTNKVRKRGIVNGLLLLQHHLTLVKEAHASKQVEGGEQSEKRSNSVAVDS